MERTVVDQAYYLKILISGTIQNVIESYLMTKVSEGLSKNTLRIYNHESADIR